MEFLDIKAQYASIKKDIDAAIGRVFESGTFIGGAEVESLEKEVAKFCGSTYAKAVNSGTDALFLALKALGIKQGDEVITTPFTFIASAEVIANAGAKPVFSDIESRTFNIDAVKIEKHITKKTKAIIPVHLFGQMADMEALTKIARKHNLSLIEDSAQAIGAAFKGKKAGSFGDTGCFSFFPSKNLGAYGDGGMVVTNNETICETIGMLRSHGSSPQEKYKNLILGVNSRLDAIQAAILRAKLRRLGGWNKKRQEKAFYYTKKLEGIKHIQTPFTAKGAEHVFNQYTVRIKNGARDSLLAHLRSKGIPVMIYYPLPLHLQPAFSYLRHKKGDFPEAEEAAAEVVSLPIYPELPRKTQDVIIKAITAFFV